MQLFFSLNCSFYHKYKLLQHLKKHMYHSLIQYDSNTEEWIDLQSREKLEWQNKAAVKCDKS